MRYNAKVPVGDLWDYVSNTECLTKDCVTQYIIKWDGKRWVADTLCDPDCPDIEQMLENYYTKEEVNNIINQIEDHDTTYEAGDYITITGPTNIISADIQAIKDAVDTDTTYTAGDYIIISDTNVISADYQALKDAIDTDTTYTAGTNIQISANNVISATDTTYEAGDYITITGPNNTISADIEAIKDAVDTDTTYTAGDYINISDTNVISADIQAIKDAVDTDTTYTAGDHITITGANNAINADLSDYYNKTEINEIIEGIEDHDTTYTAGDHITITGPDNAINADLSNYYNKEDIHNNYYNKTTIDEMIAAIEDHDTTYTAGIANEITGANNTINVKYDNNTIKINASNELYTDLSNYYNKQEVNELISSITPGGDPIIYTAGDNVQISSDHVISATDTTYSAGDYINISSSNVISADIEAIKDAVDTDTTYTAGDYINISSSNVISADIEAIKDQIEDTDTTYEAGVATSITGANNNINVKYDNNTIKVNSNNELYADVQGGTTYTAGDAISEQSLSANVIEVKYDNDTIKLNDGGQLYAPSQTTVAFARVTLQGHGSYFSNSFITEETFVSYVILDDTYPYGMITFRVENGGVEIASTEDEPSTEILLRFEKMNSNSTILS